MQIRVEIFFSSNLISEECRLIFILIYITLVIKLKDVHTENISTPYNFVVVQCLVSFFHFTSCYSSHLYSRFNLFKI